MFGLSFITESYIITFLYILLRFSGMVVVSPIFGRKNLPALLKAGFCVLMSIIIMMILPKELYAKSQPMLAFWVNGVKEILLGMIMGYITLVTLLAVVSAGHFIDMQIGFGMSNFFDQSIGMNITVTGNLLNVIYILLFFVINGHHNLIELMFASFRIITPGNVVIGAKVVSLIVIYFGWFVLLITKFAMPIIAVTIAIEFGLGIILKTMPQMNMFVIGIPLKIVVGIVMLMLFLSAFITVSQGAFEQMFEWYKNIVSGMIE